MRQFLIAATLILGMQAAAAQVRPAPPRAAEAAPAADSTAREPVLVGGLEELARRISYPVAARAARIQGTVFVQFNVNADGSTSDYRLVRSPSELLSSEAVRVVRGSTFEPAIKAGRPVTAPFTLPIQFLLQ